MIVRYDKSQALCFQLAGDFLDVFDIGPVQDRFALSYRLQQVVTANTRQRATNEGDV